MAKSKKKATSQPSAPTVKKRRNLKYTPKLGMRMCKAIAKQDLGFEHLCKLSWFPGTNQFYRWLMKHEDLALGYARAKRIQAHRMAHQQVEIADESPDHTGPQQMKAKLRCESRRWAASRLAPRSWGDKIEVAGDANNPLVDWKALFDLAEGKKE